MNVYFRRYRLTPLKALNRLSSLEEREGVHLMVKNQEGNSFADYFPHGELGDVPVEAFLETFKNQEQEYDRKALYFLLNDHKLREQKTHHFKNHQLWDGLTEVCAPVIKYKLKSAADKSFMPLLEVGIKIRLDANGLFDRSSLSNWQKDLPQGIEYLEDPMQERDWSGIALPLAADFITGSPHHYYVYKPNAEFFPEDEKNIIFSSYMGSDLGRWQAYCELLEKGDLNLVHGIHTPGLFANQRTLFNGDYLSGFLPVPEDVKAIYQELGHGEWKILCSV